MTLPHPECQVVLAEEDHVRSMAEAHTQAFPGEFLTLLGDRFLRGFYRFYVAHPESITAVAIDSGTGRVAGLVAGGSPGLRSLFLRRHFLRFTCTALSKSLVHPRVRQRLREHLWDAITGIGSRLSGASNSSPINDYMESVTEPWSNLLSIGVHPEYRGLRLGSALMEAFRSESRKRGYRYMRLSVHNDNVAAIGLYEKCGWSAIARTPTGTYFWRSSED